MKNFTLIIVLFWVFNPKIVGQSICDQFIAAVQKPEQGTLKKRTFRITSQIKDDKNKNITEVDTFGKIHFWGNIGSLRIESFYADGKRYSKIQSDFIQNDEWTWQEVNVSEVKTNKWLEIFKTDLQNIDCQLIGTEKIKLKKCAILSYSIQKRMPKRNRIDSFLIDIHAKTWFCSDDNLVYKHVYEMTTELLSQTVNATIEYDAPIKIDIPKKAIYENSAQTTPTLPVTVDSNKQYEEKKLTLSDSSVSIEQKKIVLPDSTKIQDTSTIFAVVDQAPEYKEGLPALYKYISNNMQFPEEARKEGLSGTVHVAFVVETNGVLSNIQIKRSVREDVDLEAIRVIKSMSGAWKAGKINGKDVRSTFTLPLRFELRE